MIPRSEPPRGSRTEARRPSRDCARWAALLCLVCASPCEPGAAPPPSADTVMARAEARFRALADYECVADCASRLGRKQEAGTYRLWFKQPDLIRTRVLAGKQRGAEVA